jgi:hypothetical protein
LKFSLIGSGRSISPSNRLDRPDDVTALPAREGQTVTLQPVELLDAVTITGLDELIPFGEWRTKLEEAERSGGVTPGERKVILVEAFAYSLKRLGKYDYVAETTVLRPVKDRPSYCLFYATRHPKGIEVFRDCQINALREESKTRAATKVKHATSISGQGEFFESLHDMAPDKLESFLRDQCIEAEKTLLELAPKSPHFIDYEKLRAQVLARQVVRVSSVNKIAARLCHEKRLRFPDWERGKRVPQRSYRTQIGNVAPEMAIAVDHEEA